MAGCDVIDKVVCYILPPEGEIACGLVIGWEGSLLHILEYAPVGNAADHLQHLENRIAEETAVISSLKAKLHKLAQEAQCKQTSAASGLKGKMLQWAKDRLLALDPEDVVALSRAAPASDCVRNICVAITAIVKNQMAPVNWSLAQHTLRDTQLIQKLCALDRNPISQALHDSIASRFSNTTCFSYEAASQESPTIAVLYKWVTAFIDYQRDHHMKSYDTELQQQLEACANGIAKAERRRAALVEDLELSRRGMLMQRTANTTTIPLDAVVHMAVNPLPLSQSQFVICNFGSDGRLNPSSSQPLPLLSTAEPRMLPPQEVTCAVRRLSVSIPHEKSDQALPIRNTGHDPTSIVITATGDRTTDGMAPLPPRGLGSSYNANRDTAAILAAENDALKEENSRFARLLNVAKEQQILFHDHLLRSLQSVRIQFAELNAAHSLLLVDYGALHDQHTLLEQRMQSTMKSLVVSEQNLGRLERHIKVTSREMFLSKAVLQMIRWENVMLRDRPVTSGYHDGGPSPGGAP